MVLDGKKRVYFDHASTSPIRKEIAEQVFEASQGVYGNPASLHQEGARARQLLESARKEVAELLDVEPEGVAFTSGATEASHLALLGHYLKYPNSTSRSEGPEVKKTSYLTSTIEHPSVVDCIRRIGNWGAPVTLVSPSPLFSKASRSQTEAGKISFSSEHFDLIRSCPQPLASFQYFNALTGVVQPIESLGAELKAINQRLLFHTDCAQAAGRVPLPGKNSAVDFYSLSAHKFGGPKGIGALVATRPLGFQKLEPLFIGGGQENGHRSGTPAPALAHGLARALRFALEEQSQLTAWTAKLKSTFCERSRQIPALADLIVLSPEDAHSAIFSFSLPSLPASSLVQLLDDLGFAVSSGSACHSKKSGPDPVLTAFGFPESIARSAIRLSFSLGNQPEEILDFVAALEAVVTRARRLTSSSPRGQKTPTSRESDKE